MKLIENCEKLIPILDGDNSLRDGKIQKLEIYQRDWVVIVDVYFQMRPYSDFKSVLLRFSDCLEFCFLHSKGSIFDDVELLKFFQNEKKLFYVSFDPYDEKEEVCLEKDTDYILAKEVSAYVLES